MATNYGMDDDMELEDKLRSVNVSFEEQTVTPNPIVNTDTTTTTTTTNNNNNTMTHQKPAVLVNCSGEQLVDPLEKSCQRLDEVTRCVFKYYLTPMQKEIDLDNPRPTLAQRTRYNRLVRLNSILNDMIQLCRDSNKWRTKNTKLPSESIKMIDRTVHHITQITTEMRNTWLSLSVAVESVACLHNIEAFERKLIEYHVCLEDLLEALIKMTLRLQKNKEVAKLNSLPIPPDSLAHLEMTFPVKLGNHDQVLKEIHSKRNLKTTKNTHMPESENTNN